MAERQAEKQDSEELNQLEAQVKDIQLEVNKILMAPRQEKEIKKAATTNEDDINDDDLAEISNVADNLDSLNSVLDTIEERADSIRAQLLELLSSNREIRQSLQEENEKNQRGHQTTTEETSESVDKPKSESDGSP